MREVVKPPLYFSWRVEHGMPYLVNFYLKPSNRTFANALAAIRYVRQYFKELGFTHLLMNTMVEDTRIEKAVTHHFRVKPYGEADGHKFYLVEV